MVMVMLIIVITMIYVYNGHSGGFNDYDHGDATRDGHNTSGDSDHKCNVKIITMAMFIIFMKMIKKIMMTRMSMISIIIMMIMTHIHTHISHSKEIFE